VLAHSIADELNKPIICKKKEASRIKSLWKWKETF